jgi:cysteine desulfurase
MMQKSNHLIIPSRRKAAFFMTIYLDCNATTPIEPRVRDLVLHYMEVEYGNAGSRTHSFGAEANKAVQKARAQIASVVNADPSEVIFTSGATESNNLSILGLAEFGERTGRRHIVSTEIEHKAVLEPLEVLEARGFEVTLVKPNKGGWVDADEVLGLVRDDTLLVSVMQVNNETGVIQPIEEIAEGLGERDAYFHVDAAQGFGKEIEPLRNDGIDFISISGHKVYAPMGVGALVSRARDFERPPLKPLMFGGGQERGIRPGTLPVPLVAGLGLAAEIAEQDHGQRASRCRAFGEVLLRDLGSLKAQVNGDSKFLVPHVLNVSIPGLDSEAAMLAAKEQIAISNGSACTSQSYQPSHVLKSMDLDNERIEGALRISWCHLTNTNGFSDTISRWLNFA